MLGNVAPINPGSIPAPAIASLSASGSLHSAQLGSSTGLFGEVSSIELADIFVRISCCLW